MKNTKYIEGVVSVVIPTYNHSQFVTDTIESVLNQTYKNLEIIVADDCSTDETQKIIKDLAAKDSRIKLLLSDKNMGIPANFNRAFDAVIGEFVAFLGGDDLMLPDKIEKQIEVLKGQPEVVQVIHDMEIFESETNKVIYKYGDNHLPPLNPLDWIFPFHWGFYKKYTSILPSACLARSDYYLHSRYDDRLHYKHELLFTLDNFCANKMGKWHYIDEVLGKYRVHQENFSMQKKNKVSIPEETRLLCSIAKVRYPHLTKRINNHEQFFLFKQILFNNWSSKDVRYYEKQFKIEAGWIKYMYLKLCQLMKKLGLFQPFVSVINKF